MFPVEGSHPHALGVQAFAGARHVVPGPHWALLEQGGSKFAHRPASGVPASVAPVQTPPPQSLVQKIAPLVASHPHADGTHCDGSRRQTRPGPHMASDEQGGSKPTHAPASGARGRHTPPPQSAVQTMEPLAGSHPHADGLHWFGSRTQRFPGPHIASLLQGGMKPTQNPPSGAPASTTPASRTWQTPPPQSLVHTMPFGPQAHALGRHTPGVRTHASPRRHWASFAHGGRKPTQRPASGEPASIGGAPQTPPPQSSVQITSPVAGSQPHAEGLHAFGSRRHTRPRPHCASELHGGSKPRQRLGPPSCAVGRARQMRPLQSAVQVTLPVAGSQPQADGAQRRSSGGRHASPARQSKSDWHGGTKLAHRFSPASVTPASVLPASSAPASSARRGWQTPRQIAGQTCPGAHPLEQPPSSSARHSKPTGQSGSAEQPIGVCRTGEQALDTTIRARHVNVRMRRVEAISVPVGPPLLLASCR
jgi:hypothetical protein